MLPQFIKSAFWSYDTKKVTLQGNKELIVRQILNYGDRKATDWLFKKIDRKEIRKIAAQVPRGAWDKKSLNYWSLVLNISPREKFSSK